VNHPFRNLRRSAIAAGLGLTLVLGACGGDDDTTAPDPEQTDATSVESSAEASTGAGTDCSPVGEAGPTSTMPAEVPEEYLGALGPVDVCGPALPPLTADDPADDEALGSTAPTLVGVDFEGNPVRIDAAQDGPTMVVFVAHWCPHCNAEIPVLNELRDAGSLPDDLNIVAVSTAPRTDGTHFPPDEWLVDVDWQWPAMADGVDMASGSFIAADAYGVNSFPFITIVDGDGKVAARWSGESAGSDEVIERIESALA
jgi:cytochrome c biogenesis protein CcmG/thiol:disulfide interchange protein DsbE